MSVISTRVVVQMPIGEALPEPLVGPEVTMRGLDYMPLHVAQLKSSRSWLRAKRKPELGFYMVNLWTAAFFAKPAGSLENDDDVLADAAMCDPERWVEVRDEVLQQGWQLCSDGRVYNRFVATLVRETWDKRRSLTARGTAGASARWTGHEAAEPKPKAKPAEPSPTKEVAAELDRTFAEFYAVYPLKRGRGAARKAWPAALRKVGGKAEVLIEAAKQYAALCAGTEARYIKQPSGWLNDERWADPLPLEAATRPAADRPPPRPNGARRSNLDWMAGGLDVESVNGIPVANTWDDAR